MDWIKQIGRLILIMMLQVLLIDNLQFMGVCHPYVYLICLLMMPMTLPHWVDMMIGMLIGMLVDMTNNSPGVHMAACILVMYIRRQIVSNYVSDRERLTGEINTITLGIGAFIKYTILLTAVHHTLVFMLASWSLKHLGFTLLEIVVSATISLLLMMGYVFLHDR